MSFLRRLLPFFRSSVRGRKGESRRSSLQLTVTLLEDRQAPALLTVNTLVDAPVSATTSTLSLREAITLIDSGGKATDAAGQSLALAKASQVDTANPFGSDDTIRFAADLIGVTPEVVTLDHGTLTLSRSVTIVGPGAGELAVSGDNLTRVFEIGSAATVSIAGLSIEGGAANGDGGGIVNYGQLTLTDVNVFDNQASSNAGGIANFGQLTLTDSAVTGDTAGDNDGGMVNSGTLTLTGSSISGNLAVQGNGGFANYSGTVVLTDSTVTGNTAYCAGGIGNYGGTLLMTNSTVSGNVAQLGGGGLINTGALTLADSTVGGNFALGGGGIVNTGSLLLTGSSISGNVVQAMDGGIQNFGTLTLSDSTVIGNAAGNVGGVGSYSGTFSASNSVIAGNAGGDLPAVTTASNSLLNVIGSVHDVASAPQTAVADSSGLGQAASALPGTTSIYVGRAGGTGSAFEADTHAMTEAAAATSQDAALLPADGTEAAPEVGSSVTAAVTSTGSVAANGLSAITVQVGTQESSATGSMQNDPSSAGASAAVLSSAIDSLSLQGTVRLSSWTAAQGVAADHASANTTAETPLTAADSAAIEQFFTSERCLAIILLTEGMILAECLRETDPCEWLAIKTARRRQLGTVTLE